MLDGGNLQHGSIDFFGGIALEPSSGSTRETSLPPARVRLMEEEFVGTPQLLFRLASRAAATLQYKLEELDEPGYFISVPAGSGLRRLIAAPCALQFEKVGVYRFRVAPPAEVSASRRSSRAARKLLKQMRRLAQ